jgi:hypothetical protein
MPKEQKLYAITMQGGRVASNDGLCLIYIEKKKAEDFVKWHNKVEGQGVPVRVEEVTVNKAQV